MNHSIYDLVINSGPIVKFVMLILLLFSVFSWAIIFYKYIIIKTSRVESNKFLDSFWKSKSLDNLFVEAKTFSGSPISQVYQAAYHELKKLAEFRTSKTPKQENQPGDLVLELDGIQNIERTLRKASFTEISKLESMTTFLATTATSSPFIGLFGTVWGIMTSFQEIGKAGSANLAVVAPGISEALIATATGLAAAIPAAIAYNYFTNKIRSLATEMDNFSADFLNIVQRNFFRS